MLIRARDLILYGLGLAAIFVLLVAFSGYYFLYGIHDNREFESGTIDYYVVVMFFEAVGEFPILGNTAPAKFKIQQGDGPRPPSASISYVSRLSEEELRASILRELEGKNFSTYSTDPGHSSMSFRRGKIDLDVWFTAKESSILVEAWIVDRQDL